jgi:hypothetical protein
MILDVEASTSAADPKCDRSPDATLVPNGSSITGRNGTAVER